MDLTFIVAYIDYVLRVIILKIRKNIHKIIKLAQEHAKQEGSGD